MPPKCASLLCNEYNHDVDDSKLQKVLLGPDWIDLSFGEPKVVTQALFRQINRFGDPYKMPEIRDLLKWEYQPAAGKPDLIKILEDKYDTKVVVGNGAKQCISACMYALKQRGYNRLYYDVPYYPGNPALSKLIDLPWGNEKDADSFLITTPNNPDGRNYSNVDLIEWRYRGPMIHDGAYYTDIYLPDGQMALPMGDMQIFSCSKMYGLSGIRVGYAVIHNERYYQDVVNYMEMSTAGVSAPSQDIVRNLELLFKEHPEYYNAFVKEARESIRLSREELKALDPEVLELMPCQSNSMFGWFKKGPKYNGKAAKVHMVEGEAFGQPGMIRMNIAHPPEVIREAVRRLNDAKNIL